MKAQLKMLLLTVGLLSAPAYAGETITYGYDVLGRLVTAAHSGSVNSGILSSYTFDAADNRPGVTVAGSAHSSLQIVIAPKIAINTVQIID